MQFDLRPKIIILGHKRIDMSWTEMILGLGDFLLWSFKLLPILGNNFNWLIILVGVVMGAWWIRKMVQFDREAEQNGTLP